MQAITLVPVTGPNPAYDISEARAAKQAGEPYIQQTIDFPVGTVIDHPHVWIHCCAAKPKLAPNDEECHAKVTAYLNHPRRKALLAQIKHMANPAVLAKLPSGLQKFVKAMSTKWADQLASVDADPSATPANLAAAAGIEDEDDDDFSVSMI